MKTSVRIQLVAAAIFIGLNFSAFAQSTTFTYQGRLLDGGTPANGTNYGMLFNLYSAPTNGSELGTLGIASVTVSNGLFTVPLDFGDVFDGQPRWLEISVQKDGGKFSTLAPRQPVTSMPYAIRALTAGGVADGSITSASIAPGSLDGSVIQTGTITSNLLAPGAVNVAALQSPYQSGRIPLDAYTPPAHFGSTIIDQPVNFPQSFASNPNVTVSLETDSRLAATGVPPILVSGKTPTGFTATFNVKSTPVTVSRRGAAYFHAGFPLLMVNGRPAIAFNGPGLSYVRAKDSHGLAWGTATALATESADIDMAIINGHPAIAYFSNNKLQFVRATDLDGTNWPAPTVVRTATSGVYVPQVVSLAEITGRPAMAIWNSASNELDYVRANDSNGDSWPANDVLLSTQAHADFQLADVTGNPAVAYCWDNGLAYNNVSYQTEVRFVRALDSNGNSWPSSAVTVTNFGVLNTVYSARLLMVGTKPAVTFGHNSGYNDYEVAFASATDTTGSAWASPTTVNTDYNYAPGAILFTLVNSKPAIAWYSQSYQSWYYAESSNGGTTFQRYPLGGSGSYPGSLIEVDGEPAFTMSSNGGVVYLRDTNPITDSYINWIAVQP